jgi:FkbM family methyltransferase
MTFYSQCGEDTIIFNKYFKDKQNGVFLELGAMDGVIYSNTKFFEDTYGWTGVLIEPDTRLYTRMISARPRSKCYNCAVSNKEKTIDMIVDFGNPAVSTVLETAAEHHLKVWHSKNSYIVKVQTRTLSSILNDAGITHIDFFSLDVEGHEYEVLDSMDWSIPVHVILVEVLGENDNDKVRNFLKEKGFVYDGNAAHNEVWVNPNYQNVVVHDYQNGSVPAQAEETVDIHT